MHDKNKYFMNLELLLKKEEGFEISEDELYTNQKMVDFVNHQALYGYIISVQVIDIITNFFIYNVKDFKENQTLSHTVQQYLKSTFIIDAIAVVPYVYMGHPEFLFLRYLKIIRITNYQKYFDDFLIEMMEPYTDNEKIKNLINMFDLIVLLSFVSHFCACIWIRIGSILLIDYQQGWIYESHQAEFLELDYWSQYIAAVFFIITTFTSVGYGDIKGNSKGEFIFVMCLEMVGIGFYGYMIGAFQALFMGMAKSEDQFDDVVQELNQWLMQLGKQKTKEQYLQQDTTDNIRMFINNKFKSDIH